MIVFEVKIIQSERGVDVKLSTPPSRATQAEIDTARAFQKLIGEWTAKMDAVMDKPWSHLDDVTKQ